MATASVKDNLLQTSANYLFIGLVIVCLAFMLYFLLQQGQKLMQKMGPSLNQIINKLVAFFTFCIGLQISVEGISKIFHIAVL
jgi:small neutral amino acid transporter SnatA (MarC family)